VLLSTVRSLPQREIDPQPSDRWRLQNLGFITDQHQINVAITRAKLGLIVIGSYNNSNKNNNNKLILKRHKVVTSGALAEVG